MICDLEQEGIIQAIKTKATNGRMPPLHAFYWLLPKTAVPTWDKLEMLRLSDHLDFSYYKRNPEFQTQHDWKIALKLYVFLQGASNRMFVSVEERSLELFDQEKFLVRGGAKILNQFGISLEQLKARRRGEAFVSYLRPGVSLHAIKRVLISENLSFYHTAIAKSRADLIIYGQGKKIENSLRTLQKSCF